MTDIPAHRPGQRGRVRILHTSDWQIGMKRYFLANAGCQERFDEDRLQAIEKIFNLATEHQVEAIVVAGDVFDDNLISDATWAKVRDVLARTPVPLFLLPGNHDSYEPTSIYRRDSFLQLLDATASPITILTDTQPVQLRKGVEIIGAPLLSRHTAEDLPAAAIAQLQPAAAGQIRILVGHGATQRFGGEESPNLINLDVLNRACEQRIVDYVALGDTHSAKALNQRGSVWYSGAPETTDFRKPGDRGEVNSGNALIVDIALSESIASTDAPLTQDTDSARPQGINPTSAQAQSATSVQGTVASGTTPASVTVYQVPVGTWTFEQLASRIDNAEDMQNFLHQLRSYERPRKTVIRYELEGVVNLETHDALRTQLADIQGGFALLEEQNIPSRLIVQPTEEELAHSFDNTSYLQDVMEELLDTPDDPAAQSAALLLYRWVEEARKENA